MRKLKLLSLLFAGALSLSIASFSSHAEEMGETSIGEPPILEESELEPPEVIELEAPIVGGRSERLAYLSSMRHYYAEDGENRPLWEYADWLITEQGWDPNGWLFELLGELYPDESPVPEPIPAPEEPIVWEPKLPIEESEIVIPDFDYRQERIGYIKAVRADYGEENELEDFAKWMVDTMGWEEDLLWSFLYEAYPEESERTAHWLSENRCGLQQSEVIEVQEDEDYAEPNPEPNPDPVPPFPPTNGFISGKYDDPYTVVQGDNLWKIAERLWGDGKMWIFIYHANEEAIAQPNRIYAGQVLIIPYYYQYQG